jgi:nitroimidazol reductase NimA-like FMN-containing flavoprotein (pyridoxamine 5'-phosphate oxidase superfamily)
MATRKAAADRSGGPSSNQKSAPGRPQAHDRVLRVISPRECLDLLEPGGLGRVGFTAEDGVMMLPVNFAVSGNAVVFRTAPDTLLALQANARVSFEADHFDDAFHEGWSVLVRGHAHQVMDEHEVRHLEDATCLEPWAPGPRDVYVRIVPTHISGRGVQPR